MVGQTEHSSVSLSSACTRTQYDHWLSSIYRWAGDGRETAMETAASMEVTAHAVFTSAQCIACYEMNSAFLRMPASSVCHMCSTGFETLISQTNKP